MSILVLILLWVCVYLNDQLVKAVLGHHIGFQIAHNLPSFS